MTVGACSGAGPGPGLLVASASGLRSEPWGPQAAGDTRGEGRCGVTTWTGPGIPGPGPAAEHPTGRPAQSPRESNNGASLLEPQTSKMITLHNGSKVRVSDDGPLVLGRRHWRDQTDPSVSREQCSVTVRLVSNRWRVPVALINCIAQGQDCMACRAITGPCMRSPSPQKHRRMSFGAEQRVATTSTCLRRSRYLA